MPGDAAPASHLAGTVAISFPTRFRQTPVRPNAEASTRTERPQAALIQETLPPIAVASSGAVLQQRHLGPSLFQAAPAAHGTTAAEPHEHGGLVSYDQIGCSARLSSPVVRWASQANPQRSARTRRSPARPSQSRAVISATEAAPGASWMQTTGVLPYGCRCPSVRRILRVADIGDCWEEAAYDHALACLPLDERRCPGRRRIWTAGVS
jgi:hypothetical protein